MKVQRKQLNVSLHGEMLEALTEMSRSSGKSISELLHDAVVIEKWIRDVRKSGGRLLVERNGEIREAVIK